MSATGCHDFEENQAIEKLQVRMKNDLTPVLSEDATLFYRFLKARDFDVDKAEKMLRKHIIWRKVFQVDTILEDFKPKEVFSKILEPSFIGFDKQGNIVRYSPTGRIDITEALKCVKMNNYMKHWAWFGEKNIAMIKEQIRKTGNASSQNIVLILDLDKLEFSNAASKQSADLFLRFTNLYQDNYPERMSHIFVINAPVYYVLIFTILKAVMSNAMLKKIHVFGYNGWKEKLLEVIDADVLPAFLGGIRADLDENTLCKTFINSPNKMKDFHLSNSERYFKDYSEIQTIIIPALENKEIHIEVNEEGSVIQWRFLVKGKDIRFGLFFQVSDQESEEVIPMEKYNTSDGTVEDMHRCRFTGKYTILFVNSYSWLNAKEIQFWISIQKPDS